jgi:hypothetical protein
MKFKKGDICIAIKGFYKGKRVEVLDYFHPIGTAPIRIHARIFSPDMYTMMITEEELELESVVNSPLYEALT